MFSPDRIAAMSDQQLVDALASCAEERRRIDADVARLSGEIKVRSDRALGYSGLAQQKGARTTEILVQQVTGLSRTEAAAVVRVGSRPDFLESVTPDELGVAKVDAVRRGLGEASESVSEDDLRAAAERLAGHAPHLSVEDLAARSRAARDDLDAANIAARDAEQRDQRFLSITPRLDGMYNVRGLLDAESAAVINAATDAIIRPRRGGPRFVDKEKAAEQERVALEDERTIPQMMVDALVDLVSVAVATDDGAVLTGGKGQVILHTVRNTDGSVGAGYFEGQLDAVSREILERHLCDDSSATVGFEHGLPVDSSTDQRLFNRRQRRALAARWGGCGFTGCDRPPPWTEAHHIRHWAEGNHKTETADGILLCRYHHMLLHNNGWRIDRVGNNYYLHAPDGTVTRLESKSPLYRKHRGGEPRHPQAPQPELVGARSAQ
jgi:hypothetical protein